MINSPNLKNNNAMKKNSKKIKLTNSEVESVAQFIYEKANREIRAKKSDTQRSKAVQAKAAKIWHVMKQLPPDFRPLLSGTKASQETIARKIVDRMDWPSVKYKSGIVAAVKLRMASDKIYQSIEELCADIDPFINDFSKD